jgi:hypothetical protein
MALLALKLMLALLEKYGMFSLTLANALKPLIGMEYNVKFYLNVLEAKFLIVIMSVHALQVMYGQKIIVYIHPALEAKFGLEQSVHVPLV